MSAAGKRALRANQHMRESMWTADEALAWAREHEHGRWPRRRFRVEGGAMGNSRLLGKKAAQRAAREYGGHVHELIPTEREGRK